MTPPHYRAIERTKGIYEIEYRKNYQEPYTHYGTAVKYSTGVISFDGDNYKTIQKLIHTLESTE
jgi:hypothetical protein